jgi:uncharacterized protein YdaU (DUF1376 family)
MADLHWFPVYVSEWIGSRAISMMLPEQEGAFWRLLLLAWGDGDVEPSLPDNDAALAQMSRLGRRWTKLGGLLREQFAARDGRLYNDKLSVVWRDQQDKHEVAAKRASAGGKARAAKMHQPEHAQSSASSTPGAVLDDCSTGAPNVQNLELRTEKLLEQLENLSITQSAVEAELAAWLPTDADRVALTKVLARAPSHDACIASLHAMRNGMDVPRAPTNHEMGSALRDFDSNGSAWNVAHFRGYLSRRFNRPDPALKLERRPAGATDPRMERAREILEIAKRFDLLSMSGGATDYDRRRKEAANDPKAGARFLDEIRPLRLFEGIGDKPNEHFAVMEIASRMARGGKVA